MNNLTQKVMPFLSKYKIHITVALIVFLIVFFTMSKKNVERLTQVSMLDNVTVLRQCENMTPIQLFALFNNNLDAMTKAVLDNGLTTDDLAKQENYPKIASFLTEKKVISC